MFRTKRKKKQCRNDSLTHLQCHCPLISSGCYLQAPYLQQSKCSDVIKQYIRSLGLQLKQLTALFSTNTHQYKHTNAHTAMVYYTLKLKPRIRELGDRTIKQRPDGCSHNERCCYVFHNTFQSGPHV